MCSVDLAQGDDPNPDPRAGRPGPNPGPDPNQVKLGPHIHRTHLVQSDDVLVLQLLQQHEEETGEDTEGEAAEGEGEREEEEVEEEEDLWRSLW